MGGQGVEIIFDRVDAIDFGTVDINTKSKKTFEVKNNASIEQVYTVERYVDMPKLDSGFKVVPTTSTAVKPGKSFRFQVELTPKVVKITCCDYFVIRHLFGVEATLFTKATIEGPECSLSCSKIQIVCPHDTNKCAKKFQIRNSGSSLLTYHFQVDKDHSIFTLSPSQGKVKPKESVDVTVSFLPVTKRRLFFKRVFCLVEYHEPLVLDIFAVRLKQNENPSLNVDQTNLPTYKNAFHCFMNNLMSTVLTHELPIISMTHYHMDFKHCALNNKKFLEFSVTNNFDSKLVLEWNERFDKVFSVQPLTVELEANSSATFKASFQPSFKDRLFCTDFEARLLSSHGRLVPFPVEINLKGDSFEETSCGWAAQYRVNPRCLTLPPCTSSPFQPSYSTLTIHRFGHLPLAFQFHPPERSNFLVKPQQGLIQKSFQIVLVQFQPRKVHDLIYVEKWMLSFNSNEDVNQCYVEFGASIETPRIVINHGQDVVFPKLHPRSPTEILVDLYNPTRFSFWFNEEVLRGDSVLMVGHGGEIRPHEHKRVAWTFCPQGVGELEALVSCTPSMGADVEVNSTTAVVRGVCEETLLQVAPHGLFFDKALCGCEHERGFDITNTGEAIISGTLMWLSGENNTNDDVTVRFEPDTFTLRPGDSILVKVFVIPHTKGTIGLTIGYSLNETSATPLVPVFIDGVFPFVQVSDIRINNTGPLFTKLDFWRTLRITKINELLETIKPEGTENLNMSVPSLLCTSDAVTVELLLENFSEVGVDLKLTAEKVCDCEPRLEAVSFSRSRWDDACPHKTQVAVSPLACRLEAFGSTVLTVDVSYATVGHVECLFDLTFTPEDYANINCCLKLKIGRYGIPDGSPHLDSIEPKEKDGFVFNMKPVFIGDCYPFVQAFCVYNSTKHSVYYEVDDKFLFGTPFKYVGDRSSVSPLSKHALLFTFLPNSCETFSAFVDLTINSVTKTKLILNGRGTLEKENDDVDRQIVTACGEKLSSLRPRCVFLSTSHINVGPMKQGCAQRRVLFFNNKTKEIFSFKWHTTKLPKVVEIRVHPEKGAVQPGGVAECRVVVYSKGWPCDLTLRLTCVCASFSKYASMVQRTLKYREDADTCAEYFLITEDGADGLELVPPPEDWPRKKYLTVSVHVDVKYDAVADDVDVFLPFAPPAVEPDFRDSLSDFGEGHKLLIIQAMEMVLWEALEGLRKISRSNRDEPVERYATMKNSCEQTDVAVPHQVLQTSMEDLLYSVWQSAFQLTPRNSTEHWRRTLLNNLQQISTTGFGSDESVILIQQTPSNTE